MYKVDKYRWSTSAQLKEIAIKILREAGDAGFTAMEACDYLRAEDPALCFNLMQFQISLPELWRAMRVQKIDEEKGETDDG